MRLACLVLGLVVVGSAPLAALADVELDRVPRSCREACEGVVALKQRCEGVDASVDDDDTLERECVCTAENAQGMIRDCAACIARSGGGFENDAAELARECSFTGPHAPSGAGPHGSWSSGVPPGEHGRPTGAPGFGHGGPGSGQGEGRPEGNGRNHTGHGQNHTENGQGGGRGNGQGGGHGNDPGSNQSNGPGSGQGAPQGSANGRPNAANLPTVALAAVVGGLVGFAALVL